MNKKKEKREIKTDQKKDLKKLQKSETNWAVSQWG